MSTPNSARTEESTDLISGVLTDARELAIAEVDRLKAEVKQVGQTAKTIGIGLGVFIVGAVLLGQALGFGLFAAGLPMWASFAIVGAIFVIGGIVFVRSPREATAA
jgi:hypothetical protein